MLYGGDRAWTAAELRTSVRALADAIASRLETSTARADRVPAMRRVVIFGGVNAISCQAWLGTVLTGAVATVLDDRMPAEWTERFIDRISPDLILHDDDYAEHAANVSRGVATLQHDVVLRKAAADFSAGRLVDPGPLAALTGPATTILSSGSTGEPKEVLLSHEALDGFISVREIWDEPRPDDVIAFLHPLGMVTGPHLLSVAWRTGRAVATYDVHRDGFDGLVDIVRKRSITHLLTQTSLVRSLLRVGDLRSSAVRTVMVGGEPLQMSDLSLAREALPVGHGFRVVYGTSECGVVASAPITIGTDLASLALRPHADVDIAIVDEFGNSLPTGTAGEIRASSRRLAVGYLVDGRLVTDRFVEVDERRWFLTGDCARMRADGTIELLGRADTRLKIRGYNVFPEAVEAALSRIDGVRDAVVVGTDRPGGGTMLSAFIVPTTAPPISTGDLRRALNDLMPDYCVPSVFVMTDVLPTLANGKRDRSLLRQRASGHRFELRAGDGPRTSTERSVHRLAATLLGLDELGVHDDLLDLGMDSLMLAELAVQVADVLGWAPNVSSLIRAPTIAAICAPGEPTTGLVPLAAGPPGMTIVLVPGAGATIAYLRPLAHLLAPLGNVVAHPAGDEPSIDIEAEQVTRAMRVPNGASVIVVGHSWGGIVAHAAVRRLRASGVDVRLLVLLDTDAPPPSSGPVASVRRVRARRAARRDERTRPVVAATSRTGASLIGDQRFYASRDRVSWHRPRRVDVATLLIRAEGHVPMVDPGGWMALVGQLDVVDVAGSHGGLLVEPFVNEVANSIRRHVNATVPGIRGAPPG